MKLALNSKIDEQREKVLGNHPEVILVSPCKCNNGVLNFSNKDITYNELHLLNYISL